MHPIQKEYRIQINLLLKQVVHSYLTKTYLECLSICTRVIHQKDSFVRDTHSIKEEPAGNPDESVIQAGLPRFFSLETSLGCLAMISGAKHLKDSVVAYMHPIQKVSAGNTAESATHTGLPQFSLQGTCLGCFDMVPSLTHLKTALQHTCITFRRQYY